MRKLKLKETKRHRYYYLTTEEEIVWLSKKMVCYGDDYLYSGNNVKAGLSLNKKFVEEADRFKEIGLDCPYNQLMHKCRQKYYPLNTILKAQVN